mgnify:CR=1 FL=1|jgi:ADP-ribose pyrophosphatase YjhB (NUDIX family)
METIIAAGPVIIEDGKVLLDKEQKADHITRWLFPGGKAEPEDNNNLKQTCRREVKEELNIEIEIIKELSVIEREQDGKHWILYHFLSKRTGKITIGDDVVEYGWFDINNLPDDCSPNVYQIIEECKNML